MLTQKQKTETIKRVLAIAEGYKGTKESPKGSNITIFNIKYYGSPVRAPWCYIYANVVLEEARAKLPKCASCPIGFTWYKNKGLIYKEGKPGDLVFFTWNKARVSEHVGFVIKYLGNDYYLTNEGNTSPTDKGLQGEGDGVYEKRRHISEITGFARWIELF